MQERISRKAFCRKQGTSKVNIEKCISDAVNKVTFRWFKGMRSITARISGPMLQGIAKHFQNDWK